MNKRLLATFLIAISSAVFPARASEDPQHRNPGDAPKTGEATPRPQPRNNPDRPRPPRGGPVVVVPGSAWPWWYPYPYHYPPYGGWRIYDDWQTANIRVDVEPSDAQVFADRYYAGVVDDFDGIFQRLHIDSGAHRIQVRAQGYEPLEFEVRITPEHTTTYTGELKKIQ